MKDRPPPNASEYTKWLKEKANLELTIADARMGIPAYERHSIISQIPTSLSLTRVGLTLFRNNIYTPPFDPSVLQNLFLWFDGADMSSIVRSNGTNISKWNDKSGKNYNLTNASNTGPTIVTTSANPVGYTINYNGTNQFLSNLSISPAANSTSVTFFAVFSHTDIPGNFGRLFDGFNTVGVDNYQVLRLSANSSTGTFNVVKGDGEGNSTSFVSNSFSTGVVRIFSTVCTSTKDLSTFINGSPGGTVTVASNAVNFSRITVGVANYSSSFLPANINEIILYDSAITTQDRQKVEGYLAWKWGLQASLPSNHPYFNVKP
jgi:hypothetical protein